MTRVDREHPGAERDPLRRVGVGGQQKRRIAGVGELSRPDRPEAHALRHLRPQHRLMEGFHGWVEDRKMSHCPTI